MGADAALPALSDRAPSLFSYFKQRFAQVTNPAIDSLREDLVMSLTTWLGRGPALLDDAPPPGRAVAPAAPGADQRGPGARDRARRCRGRRWTPRGRCRWASRVWRRRSSGSSARRATAAAAGTDILVIGDRRVGPAARPIPALLAVAAVHHDLVRRGLRTRCSLVVDSGEPREVHHVACLVGYGADAVHPWLAGDEIVPALGKGLLKVMSKMGVSTVSAYRGAQVFEAIGLGPELIERHFVGTPSKLGGLGPARARARGARAPRAHVPARRRALPLAARRRAPRLEPGHGRGAAARRVAALRRGRRRGRAPRHAARAAGVPRARPDPARGRRAGDRDHEALRHRRDVARLDLARGARVAGARDERDRRALEHRRGRRGPGALRRRPALARSSRSRSARFGVTIDYLVNADELQIKVAQGAKPGEGGQLPGHKVDANIGRLRYATPGVELISPPPHHDIYSIEDLKQLIHDLRCANPSARISVKLAAEAGVGTVAAGVVKAHADHIVIAGHDGGTGASPQSSLVSAGVPWELGLAETQQTLVRNGLRSRVVLQADGGMRTGRDVVIAALLGAEEVGASTAPLVALGCIMMRVCHLNTCPVGIATQDPELRRRFAGTPEHVVPLLHAAGRGRAGDHGRRWGSRASPTSWAASTCCASTATTTGRRAGWT